MKRIIKLTLILSGLLFCMPTQAQFLKKLNKKVQDAAEKKVLDKSANKTSQSVDKGMDDIFSVGKDNKKSKNKKQTQKSAPSNSDLMKGAAANSANVQPRDSYLFSYLYNIHITSSSNKDMKGEMDFFITPNADYIGLRFGETQGMGSMFMVSDQKKSANFNFINSDSQKMMMTSSFDPSDFDTDSMPQGSDDYKITNLPSKSFLGYSCKGIQMEDDEWKIKIYYTNQVDLSLSNIFSSGEDIAFKGNSSLRKDLANLNDGLIMYMEGASKKNKKENFIMEAKKLEKIDYTFNTDGYQNMSGGMFGN